jgi:hypothetical protein
MEMKEFFGFTKEKLILFLILFYIPSVIIFRDFATGIYSNLHVYVLFGMLIVAYLISCGLCLIRQVNEFLKPTAFKLTLLALFAGISIASQVPFFDSNVLRFREGSLLGTLLLRGFTRNLFDIPSMLLQYYVYAGVVELIIRKIKKVEEIPVDWNLMVRKWWFWVIVAVLIILLISQYLWVPFLVALRS